MVKMKNILILCFFLGTISSHYSFGTFLNSWLKKGIAIGVVIVSASFLLWYLAKQGNVDQESEVKIEDPTEEDKKSIIDILCVHKHDIFSKIEMYDQEKYEFYPKAIIEERVNSNYESIKVIKDKENKIISFVGYALKNYNNVPSFSISYIFTDPVCRRQRHATHLIDHVKKLCLEENKKNRVSLRFLEVKINEDKTSAIEFFQTNGFTYLPCRKNQSPSIIKIWPSTYGFKLTHS